MAKTKKISSTVVNPNCCTVVNLFNSKKRNRFTRGNPVLPKNGGFKILGRFPVIQRYYNIPCFYKLLIKQKRVKESRAPYFLWKLADWIDDSSSTVPWQYRADRVSEL